MKPLYGILLLLCLLSGACKEDRSSRHRPPLSPRLALETIVTGLASPVDLQAPGDGSGRLFIVEEPGTIRIIFGGSLLAATFLDIRSKVDLGGVVLKLVLR